MVGRETLAGIFHSRCSFIFFFKDFYLFAREREYTQAGREGGRSRREAGSLPSKEPDAGLDPRTLGSGPEPKAAA